MMTKKRLRTVTSSFATADTSDFFFWNSPTTSSPPNSNESFSRSHQMRSFDLEYQETQQAAAAKRACLEWAATFDLLFLDATRERLAYGTSFYIDSPDALVDEPVDIQMGEQAAQMVLAETTDLEMATGSVSAPTSKAQTTNPIEVQSRTDASAAAGGRPLKELVARLSHGIRSDWIDIDRLSAWLLNSIKVVVPARGCTGLLVRDMWLWYSFKTGGVYSYSKFESKVRMLKARGVINTKWEVCTCKKAPWAGRQPHLHCAAWTQIPAHSLAGIEAVVLSKMMERKRLVDAIESASARR